MENGKKGELHDPEGARANPLLERLGAGRGSLEIVGGDVVKPSRPGLEEEARYSSW